MNSFNDKVNFIWSVAELLRGPYRPNQYKDVMLPLTVLRRLDCVLEPTKDRVLERLKRLENSNIQNKEPILKRESGHEFYNTSLYTFEKLKGDPDNIKNNLVHYIKSFSSHARDIIEHFRFEEQIEKLDKADRLFLVVSRFCEIDLHPSVVPNIEMGYIFEELIRRFNEASNEEAGDHFTPREVIRLMVDLIFSPDSDTLTRKGIVRTLYDPACGTGGMLSISEEYLRELNRDALLEVFGQDYNDQAYAICGSDMLIKGQNPDNVRFGNSFTQDHFPAKQFDYMLANPPFGVEWKPERDFVEKEQEEHGYGGRFGAGTPRISDGSLLFLQHMISKMKAVEENGTRLAIVFNGSPLFTGSAGSGESEIRRWIIENDWLEAIVALPDQLFYNTPILTFLWILTNRKEPQRKDKIQLIDATSFFKKMRRSLGNKRHEVCEDQREDITRIYGEFTDSEHARIFDNEDFGYRRITVERPLKLNFAVTDERLEEVKQTSQFTKLATSKKRKDKDAAEREIEAGKRQQEKILASLDTLREEGTIKNRERFTRLLKDAFKSAELKVPATLFKAILMGLAERDETADVCRDKKGSSEPDTELRDYENVPLKEDIDEYMRREVLPHVPDAWVDDNRTKIGYEFNFRRNFFKYIPPRDLVSIESDMCKLEREIIAAIHSVLVLKDDQAEAVSKSFLDESSSRKVNPYSTYRSSDLEWLGEIPAHWEMRKLKFIADVRNSNVDKKSAEDESPIRLCNYVDVYYNSYINKDVEFMKATANKGEIRRFSLRYGDVLITKDSEMWDDIAVPALVDQELETVLCGYHLALVRPNTKLVLGEYLFRAFLSCSIRDQFRVRANGVTRYGLSIDAITSALFPLPPLEEQNTIVSFLRRETSKIKALIAGIREDVIGPGLFARLVKALIEYRSALISAAVSGKIDVRDEVSNE